MEVENESNNILTNEEKKICRMFTNSSLDIFQGNNEYCFRIEKSNQTFYNSYEYRVIQDKKYISSIDEFYNKYLEENKSDK